MGYGARERAEARRCAALRRAADTMLFNFRQAGLEFARVVGHETSQEEKK